MEIRRCTVAEIEAEPNLAELLAEYAEECSPPELGKSSPFFWLYSEMETAGYLHIFAAFVEGELAGFVIPIVIVSPHYSVTIASIESFFVTRRHRDKGLGDALRAHARDLAVDLGAKAVLWSAPINSDFARVLEGSKKMRAMHITHIEAL